STADHRKILRCLMKDSAISFARGCASSLSFLSFSLSSSNRKSSMETASESMFMGEKIHRGGGKKKALRIGTGRRPDGTAWGTGLPGPFLNHPGVVAFTRRRRSNRRPLHRAVGVVLEDETRGAEAVADFVAARPVLVPARFGARGEQGPEVFREFDRGRRRGGHRQLEAEQGVERGDEAGALTFHQVDILEHHVEDAERLREVEVVADGFEEAATPFERALRPHGRRLADERIGPL